jgi:hypothetical protein
MNARHAAGTHLNVDIEIVGGVSEHGPHVVDDRAALHGQRGSLKPDEGRVRRVDGPPMKNVLDADLGVGIQRRGEVQPFVPRSIAVPEKAGKHKHLWWGCCRIGPQTFNVRVLAIQPAAVIAPPLVIRV